MERFVILHIKNEEYMLPWWLNHHKTKFDHGIIIDYNSTDRSVEIIKQITPNWLISQSRYRSFDARQCDEEVMDHERQIQNSYPGSWMLTLTISEFLIGNTKRLFRETQPIQKIILCDTMVDSVENYMVEPDPNKSLIEQRFHGIIQPYEESNKHHHERHYMFDLAKKENILHPFRRMRSMHNYCVNYIKMTGYGRHFWNTPVDDFLILWYGFSPYTEPQIQRKLAIQYSMTEGDKRAGRGSHHITNREELQRKFDWYTKYSINLKEKIDRVENMED